MNRRDFLKRVAQTSLTAVAAVTLPQLRRSAGGKKPLGTLDGRIFESLDSGKTWQPRANFGKQRSILDSYERNGKIYAQVWIGRHSFVAESRDGPTWYTLNWVPQRA